MNRSKQAGMARNTIIVVWLVALAFAPFCPAEAQQTNRVPRIGWLVTGVPSSSSALTLEAFRQGLHDFGYIEGKNIQIESRYAEGKLDRLPSLVAELVQLKVDVLISGTLVAIRAAKQATNTIPIVMVLSVDPVATGLIDSLARPGGNITGLTNLARDLSGKRLELLKEAVPRISRVGVLRDADNQGATIGFKEYESAARALKIPLQSLEVRSLNPDFEEAFQAAAKGHARALITIRSSLTSVYRKQIADLAIKNRVPSMYEASDEVEAGGLMSYSANYAESFRRAAVSCTRS